MTPKTMASLKQERNELLKQYIKAVNNEKVSILVKIMDIDEEIESFDSNTMPTEREN